MVLVVASVAAVGLPATAQEESWIGQFVMGTAPAGEIRIRVRDGRRQVSFPISLRIVLHVRDESDDSALVHDGQREGWADKKDLVLVRDAVAYFHRRVRADPQDEFALHMRGTAWKENGEFDNAIADFNECIRLDPTVAVYFNSRGLAWSAKQDYDRAIQDYDAALRLDPKYAGAYISRGNAWYDKQDYDRAIQDYDAALRLDPKYAAAYNNRGGAWSEKGDLDKAMEDYNQALRLDPKDAFAYYNRGRAWSAKGDLDKVIEDYNQALRLDPKYAAAYNNRAWLRATCPDAAHRDGKQAVEDATKACESTGWKDPNKIDTLAAAYAEAGDYERAAAEQAKALEMVPENAKKDLRERLDLYRAGKPYREK
jgi:tetratricopeptide (TPR) repeat protein